MERKVAGQVAREAIDPSAQGIAESRTVLFNSASPAEFALQAGKVQNLRIAARELNGIVIAPDQLFSFWKNLGRTSRRRGFVEGRELREGCVIPNVGGGLCQLSNALYDVALRSGCEIVERHAHTQRVPGSTTQTGRDATIFWNYVDLRFRPRFRCQLRVVLSRGELLVDLFALDGSRPIAQDGREPIASCESRVEAAETCETCGVTKCFRNPAATSLARHGTTAWLLDKFEPEFDAWLQQKRGQRDTVFLPLKSARLTSYRWNVNGIAAIEQAKFATVVRSLGSRRLATQGAERQRALLRFDRQLAEAYAKRIPYIADHLVVNQNLLAHLWQRGDLAGRTFDVLMTRLPIAELEKTLDAAAVHHPQSRTIADFRAPPEVRDAETVALSAARYWITPHSHIARIAGDRAIKLDWSVPTTQMAFAPRDTIVFPASTLARKGCYELREVVHELNLKLKLGGPILEAANFWDGVDVVRQNGDLCESAAAFVLPAWVEHWPRRLLRAAAAGIPAIASEACGLRGVPNVIEISAGDIGALRDAIVRLRRPIAA
ncbi:MAG: VanW family protein [Chthoniobacterales bacterium]